MIVALNRGLLDQTGMILSNMVLSNLLGDRYDKKNFFCFDLDSKIDYDKWFNDSYENNFSEVSCVLINSIWNEKGNEKLVSIMQQTDFLEVCFVAAENARLTDKVDLLNGYLSYLNFISMYLETGFCNNRDVKKCLEILSHLREVHIHTGPFFHDNGLAHGLPGLIAVMARLTLSRRFDFRNSISCLSHLLISRKQLNCTSLFGYRNGEICDSRLAWCYGDISALYALELAKAATLNCELQNTIDELWEKVSNKTSVILTFPDLGLCHGALGNAYVFKRISTLGIEEANKKKSEWLKRRWLNIYLNSVKSGEKPVSFNILEGVVGISILLSVLLFENFDKRKEACLSTFFV